MQIASSVSPSVKNIRVALLRHGVATLPQRDRLRKRDGIGAGSARSCRRAVTFFASPKKVTPTFAPVSEHGAGSDPRFEAITSRGRKLAALKQPTAGSHKCATFSLQISGANTRGPLRTDSGSLRDGFTGTRMRASGLRLRKLPQPFPTRRRRLLRYQRLEQL